MFERSKWARGLVAVLALTAAAAFAQGPAPSGIEGIWEGALKDGDNTLRVALEISKKADGTLTATLISIDQDNQKIPADAVTFENHALHVEMPAAQAEYDGTLNDAGTVLTGTWKQGGGALPLNFTRGSSAPTVHRPQEPKKP